MEGLTKAPKLQSPRIFGCKDELRHKINGDTMIATAAMVSSPLSNSNAVKDDKTAYISICLNV
jgi:hypothetical protein